MTYDYDSKLWQRYLHCSHCTFTLNSGDYLWVYVSFRKVLCCLIILILYYANCLNLIGWLYSNLLSGVSMHSIDIPKSDFWRDQNKKSDFCQLNGSFNQIQLTIWRYSQFLALYGTCMYAYCFNTRNTHLNYDWSLLHRLCLMKRVCLNKKIRGV